MSLSKRKCPSKEDKKNKKVKLSQVKDKVINNKISVREFNPENNKDELNAVYEVYKTSNLDAGTSPLKICDGLDKYLKDPNEFHIPSKGKILMVALINKKIVGICKMAPFESKWTPEYKGFQELDCFAVHPDHQRKGVATAILKACINLVKNKFNKKIHLCAFYKNSAAISFYNNYKGLHFDKTEKCISRRNGTKYKLLHFITK